MTSESIPEARAGWPSVELLSTTITSVTRSEGRSASTQPMACASLRVGMITETRTRAPFGYHQREDGLLRAKKASTPHVRPALPTESASEARTETRSSQIHAVPNSEIHKLPRSANATSA